MMPKPDSRKKYLTPEQVTQVEKLAAYLSTEQIADYLGIARATFYNVMDRQPDVATAYKRGRAAAVGAIAQGLISKARGGDTTSSIFYLKTQGGWAERQKLDLSSEDGTMSPAPPAQQYDWSLLTEDELQTVTDLLEKAAITVDAAGGNGQ